MHSKNKHELGDKASVPVEESVGAGVPADIEISPAMVAAGAEAIGLWTPDDAETVAVIAYEAMERVRTKRRRPAEINYRGIGAGQLGKRYWEGWSDAVGFVGHDGIPRIWDARQQCYRPFMGRDDGPSA